MKFGFGATGVIIGTLCVTFIIFVVEYGPESYTATGSSIVYLDGTVSTEVTRPLLPQIARMAFYSCFISFLLGIASVVRKEVLVVSFMSLSLWFAPILLYTLGTTVVFAFYVGLLLLIAGCRKRLL